MRHRVLPQDAGRLQGGAEALERVSFPCTRRSEPRRVFCLRISKTDLCELEERASAFAGSYGGPVLATCPPQARRRRIPVSESPASRLLRRSSGGVLIYERGEVDGTGTASANRSPGLIVQVRLEPALRLRDGDRFAAGVVRHLVFPQLAHGEIFRLRMIEIKPAHAAGRMHGEALGQDDSGGGLGAEQIEEQAFLGMIRAGRIAGRRADAPVFLAEQFLHRQVFGAAIAAEIAGAPNT